MTGPTARYVLIKMLARKLQDAARSLGDYTALREMTFEVRLLDGYVANITVVLDRIDTER